MPLIGGKTPLHATDCGGECRQWNRWWLYLLLGGTRTSPCSAKAKGKKPESLLPVVISEDEFELVLGIFGGLPVLKGRSNRTLWASRHTNTQCMILELLSSNS